MKFSKEVLTTKISTAYRDLAIAFLCIQFVVTIVRSILKEFFGSDYLNYLILLFAPAMVIIFPLAIRVIINLKASFVVIRAALTLFVSGAFLRVSSLLLFEDVTYKSVSGILSSLLIIGFLILVISRMIMNLFSENNHIVEKLWASVCVYFMIGAVFGTFYSIILVIDPFALGITMIHPIEIYLNGMIYSLNILSGLDPIYQTVSESLQMSAVMESTLSTLFLVVLLGRLLGSPN